MQIGSGDTTYEWVDEWAKVPDTPEARAGWAHHGVVITAANEVVAIHQARAAVTVFDLDGNLLRTIKTDLTEGHQLALASENGIEYLWIADPGAKRDHSRDYEYVPDPRVGRVVKMDLSGRVALELDKPDLPVYADGAVYSPTSVTTFQASQGGNGDIWAADGYGQSYVHRYDRRGNYLSSLNGEEGGGRFDCPHAVFVDTRRADPELYIADRGNSRIQVYDLDGRFKRVFGADFLTTPSSFAVHGGRIFVAELQARLTVLDEDDRLVIYLGEDAGAPQREGWPNEKGPDGALRRPSGLTPGKFNSPHGVAADAHGNLYVPEWLIGGRFTKLAKA